jgi:hypothetical protein
MILSTSSECVIHVHIYRALKWADIRRRRRGNVHFGTTVLNAAKDGLPNDIPYCIGVVEV